jgi:DNA ligase-1
MKKFVALIWQLGYTKSTNEKIQLITNYFATANTKDIVWLIALFSGKKPKRIATSAQLKAYATQIANIPEWLFAECYDTVGDLAETIALLLPEPKATDHSEEKFLYEYLEEMYELLNQSEETRKAYIETCWNKMDTDIRFVFNKLITGGFRIGVSQQSLIHAIAKHTQKPVNEAAHLISGNWNPYEVTFEALLNNTGQTNNSKPYPFYLSYAIEADIEELLMHDEYIAEWKWDGIRGQVIKRNNQVFIWSRGEELITDKFPEIKNLAENLPDGTVLDGEIVCMQSGLSAIKPQSFATLQTRITRKTLTKKLLQDAPAAFIAYDVLEYASKDIRQTPLLQRKEILQYLVSSYAHPSFYLSPIISFNSAQELVQIKNTARKNGSEGLMLKQLNSVYETGRKKGYWWKWKLDPLVIDAVLIYAQKGHGRRSNLYTDYTFAVKDGNKLVVFTKAYSGLTDKELIEVDAFVKKHAIEKFGPVRTVKPELVFEIAFEGIAASSRHKSGVALRFPRINRWRKDKTVDEINTLSDLKQLLVQYGKS